MALSGSCIIIHLIENPKYDVPGVEVLGGATDLHTHDYIHMILGRGLLMKDEAFVLGFMNRFEHGEIRVFKDAVRLGYVSDSRSLAEMDYAPLLDLPLAEVRHRLGIEEDLLRAYYAIEKRRCPKSRESQRLFD